MKGIKLFYALGTFCLLLAVNSARSQTVAIQLYPGLTITGTVGSVYTIQASTNLAQPNGWSTLGVVQLLTTNYLWFDTTSPGNIQRFYRTLSFTNVPPSMVFIPAGTFTMGSPTNEALRNSDESQHVVTISKGFYMGKYLVTQTNYVAVVGGSNPSYFSTNNPNNPVERVSWVNATNYCALRTAQEQTAGLIPTNWTYRLPTEAEWEYACRAGTTTAFYLGSGLYSGQANFAGQYQYDSAAGQIFYGSGIHLDKTTPVGSYAANGWGLYDMIGNVWEWCQDYYGAYPSGSTTDPQGPSGGSSRVDRGGSWSTTGDRCRNALRDVQSQTFVDYRVGFRVVLAPSQ